MERCVRTDKTRNQHAGDGNDNKKQAKSGQRHTSHCADWQVSLFLYISICCPTNDRQQNGDIHRKGCLGGADDRNGSN